MRRRIRAGAAERRVDRPTQATPHRPVGTDPRRRLGVALTVVGLVVGLAACSDDPAPAPAASPTPPPTPTPTATRKPAPRPAPPVNPLTGLPGVPGGPVVAVKIDDTGSGRPQIGLEAADIVYVEQVEAGATRLVAVYASRHPGTVGPVRSVRNNDPELLAAYGRPALAYSGGAGGPVARLRRSKLVDAGAQTRGGFYRRLGSRRAPYNLVVDLTGLARAVRGVSRPVDVGFRWARTDPRLARSRKVSRVSVLVGKTRENFRWEPRSRRWQLLNSDGSLRRTASGRPISTPNVVVPFSRARLDPTNVDVLGTPSVYTSTVGNGRVLIFRDGRMVLGTWWRRHPSVRTDYVDSSRRALTLQPGGAWVLLAAVGAPVDVR